MKFLLYIIIIGFGIGVLWRSFFDLGFAFSFFVFFLGGAVALSSLVSQERRKVLLVSFVILAVGSGVLRMDIAELKRGGIEFESRTGSEAILEGVVIDEPDRRENNTNYTVVVDHISETLVREKVRVVADSYPVFHYGDRVRLEGELMKPGGFTTDAGRYFNYAAYLSKDDIFYEMIFPEISFVSSGHGNIIKRHLFSFKHSFLESIGRLIPDPESSLLGGLVVGAKQSLGEKLQQDFRTTGIIHIVVLSGYNVTIVADAIMRALSFFPSAIGLMLGVSAIPLFAIMVGGSATIVRASIMALFVILARATGRTSDMTRGLFIAGFLMLLHNPKILIHDASFQLSFLATLGLIWLAPLLEEWLHFVPSRLQFREFATATIATQIFVLPLLLYKVGELSLVALPVNLLVLITVPITMLFGFLAGVVGFVSQSLATPFAFLAQIFLSYQLGVVDLFARLPFASLHLDTFPLWLMVGIYLLYGVVLLILIRWRRQEEESFTRMLVE
ncbi:MAG: ComEC family competence protein [Candidatus Pacebacteria bacterium]|nr:ComEC family competence protein [Candidatus Paceibacterota bacterium]